MENVWAKSAVSSNQTTKEFKQPRRLMSIQYSFLRVKGRYSHPKVDSLPTHLLCILSSEESLLHRFNVIKEHPISSTIRIPTGFDSFSQSVNAFISNPRNSKFSCQSPVMTLPCNTVFAIHSAHAHLMDINCSLLRNCPLNCCHRMFQ